MFFHLIMGCSSHTSNWHSALTSHALLLLNINLQQARSSVGERYLDTVEVRGSIPLVPTMIFPYFSIGMEIPDSQKEAGFFFLLSMSSYHKISICKDTSKKVITPS